MSNPLTQRQWEISKQEADRFQIPVELVAGALATEIVYDTDFINTIYDISVNAATTIGDLALAAHAPGIYEACYAFLDAYHEYFGLAPSLEPKGIGYGPAPGLGNVHAGPAETIEDYFARCPMTRDLLPSPSRPGLRLRRLATDEGNIRYVAAYLRRYAELRKGFGLQCRQYYLPLTADLTFVDMEIIYTAYRCDVRHCYGSVQNYQTATSAAAAGHPEQIRPYLMFYREEFQVDSEIERLLTMLRSGGR